MSSRCACASKSLRLTVQGGANPNASCSKAVSRMVGPLSFRPSCSSLAPCSPPSIGIGGRLTTPPLPHHRAYGSVSRRFGGLSTRGCRAFGFGHRRGHFDLSHGRTRGFTPARYRQVQRKLEWRSHCGHETSELLALSFNPSSGTVRAFGRRSSLLCPLTSAAPRSGGLAAPSVRPGFPVGHGADLLG